MHATHALLSRQSPLEGYTDYKPQDGNLRKWVSQIYENQTVTEDNFFSWIGSKFTVNYNGQKLVTLFMDTVNSDSFKEEPSIRELGEIIQGFLKGQLLSPELSEKAIKCSQLFQEKKEALFPEIKEAKKTAESPKFPFQKELVYEAFQYLDVADLARVSRSCKQAKAVREEIVKNQKTAAFHALVQKAVAVQDFDRLISLFKTPEIQTSDYPLKLEFRGFVDFDSLGKIASFFTNIKTLHIVNHVSGPYRASLAPLKTLEDLKKKSCSSLEEYAIVDEKIWAETPSWLAPWNWYSSGQKALWATFAMESASIKRLDISALDLCLTTSRLNFSNPNTALELLITSGCISIDEINKVLLQCPNLKELQIAAPPPDFQDRLGTADFLRLSASESLTSLNLARRKIDDAGLAHIARSFPNLTEVNLEGCEQITAQGVRRLSQLPDLTIRHMR